MKTSFVRYQLAGGFPRGASGKKSACQCRKLRRHGFDPRIGKIPGEENGSPHQDYYLVNPMDRGTWWATVHGVADMTEHTHRDIRPPVYGAAENTKN